jgi:hypothetical protein
MCAVEREIVKKAGGSRYPSTATPPTRPLASRDAQAYRDGDSLARLVIFVAMKIRLVYPDNSIQPPLLQVCFTAKHAENVEDYE